MHKSDPVQSSPFSSSYTVRQLARSEAESPFKQQDEERTSVPPAIGENVFGSASYYSFLSRAINLPRKAKQNCSNAKLKPLSPRTSARSPSWTHKREEGIPGKIKLYPICVTESVLPAHPEKDLKPGDLNLVPGAEEMPPRLLPMVDLRPPEQKFTSPALMCKVTEESEGIPTDICSRQISSVAPSTSQEDVSESMSVSRYHDLKFKFLVQDPIYQGVQGCGRKWKAGGILGNGRLGNVVRAMDVHTGEMFAVKRLFYEITSDSQRSFIESLEKEVQILQKLAHPNIVKFLGSESIADSLFLYLEYLPGKSLAALISGLGPLPENLVKLYLKDILTGLKYLHERGVVHRDLKGANLLLDEEGRVHLADFGCSTQLDASCSHSDVLTSLKGSLPWMAPEVIQQAGYGRKADIWSVGCVAIELLSGKTPWQDFENQLQAIVRIGLSADLPDIPTGVSPGASDFIFQCIQRNPKQRPSARELLCHPYLL